MDKLELRKLEKKVMALAGKEAKIKDFNIKTDCQRFSIVCDNGNLKIYAPSFAGSPKDLRQFMQDLKDIEEVVFLLEIHRLDY